MEYNLYIEIFHQYSDISYFIALTKYLTTTELLLALIVFVTFLNVVNSWISNQGDHPVFSYGVIGSANPSFVGKF